MLLVKYLIGLEYGGPFQITPVKKGKLTASFFLNLDENMANDDILPPRFRDFNALPPLNLRASAGPVCSLNTS